MGGYAPTPAPGDFKSPGSRLSASRGRPWWDSKRPFGLCGSRGNGPQLSALRGTPSSALGTVLAGILPATPAVWLALLPPLRHQPRPPGCPFLDLRQALYEGLSVVQALFLPGLQGLGRGRQGNPSPPGRVPDMEFAGPSVPACIGPAVPGVSIRAAGEFAVWAAKRERPRKLERRGPARDPRNDDSGPSVL